jgi:Ca2+-binding RTX toxin-like protein
MTIIKSTNSADSILGGAGDDHLIGWLATNTGGDQGPATDADTLDGAGGNDVLEGGAGDDRLYGTSGNDSLYGGAENDALYGGTGRDELTGGSGDDTLLGGAGDDVLTDETGRDMVYGGAGNDNIMAFGDVHGSLFDGGIGANSLTLDLKGMNFHVNVSIADPNVLSGTVEGIRLLGITQIALFGGNFADVITGGALDDNIGGNGGEDWLSGGAGNDRLSGGVWNDTLIGGLGDDMIYGGTFHDVLYGNDGDDLLVGGIGRDTMYGGAGIDSFFCQSLTVGRQENSVDVLTGGAGADRFFFSFRPTYQVTVADKITDFTSGEDKFWLDRSGITSPTVDAFTLARGTEATAASDRVIYDSATGRIWFDPDGRGSAKAQLFAELVPGTALEVSDFLIL